MFGSKINDRLKHIKFINKIYANDVKHYKQGISSNKNPVKGGIDKPIYDKTTIMSNMPNQFCNEWEKIKFPDIKGKEAFYPERWHWKSFIDYFGILLISCCQSSNGHWLTLLITENMNQRFIGYVFSILMIFTITRLTIIFFLRYLITALGIYSKRGIFAFMQMIPVAAAFPIWVLCFQVVITAASLYRYSLFASCVIQYIVKELHLFEDWTPCTNPNYKCINASTILQSSSECFIRDSSNFIIECPNDSSKYIFPSTELVIQIIKNPYYMTFRSILVMIFLYILYKLTSKERTITQFESRGIYLTLIRICINLLLVIICFKSFMKVMDIVLERRNLLLDISENGGEAIYTGVLMAIPNFTKMSFTLYGATARIDFVPNLLINMSIVTFLDTFLILLSTITEISIVYDVAEIYGMGINVVSDKFTTFQITSLITVSNKTFVLGDLWLLMYFTLVTIYYLYDEFIVMESVAFNCFGFSFQKKSFKRLFLAILYLIQLAFIEFLMIAEWEIKYSRVVPFLDEINYAFVVSFMVSIVLYDVFNRLQCDIEFMTDENPTIFLTFSLWFLTIFFLIIFFWKLNYDENAFGRLWTFIAVLALIYLSRNLVYRFVYNQPEIFDLFSSMFYYGPPNRTLRIERKQFKQRSSYDTRIISNTIKRILKVPPGIETSDRGFVVM